MTAASAIQKEFLKEASTHTDGFPKAAGNFMKKSAKNCQSQ
jgi:hypothetical protein